MAALRWDEQAQAFVESTNVPMRYDAQSQAWVETTGMAWDEESQAWTERWTTGVKAYVYGAALETVTIKKDGIIVTTVDTDSTGQSTKQITLSSGTYTLTGSVSGHTEEQMVDENTTKFRAMPEGALYWYGVQVIQVERWGYYNQANSDKYSGSSITFNINSFTVTGGAQCGFMERVDLSDKRTLHIKKMSASSIAEIYGVSEEILHLSNNVNHWNYRGGTSGETEIGFSKEKDSAIDVTSYGSKKYISFSSGGEIDVLHIFEAIWLEK